jgi:hypothetical protein
VVVYFPRMPYQRSMVVCISLLTGRFFSRASSVEQVSYRAVLLSSSVVQASYRAVLLSSSVQQVHVCISYIADLIASPISYRANPGSLRHSPGCDTQG